MIRFGLPTMPAELSLYSLNFIDRIILVRLAGLAEAGLYALAVKFAQGMNVLARGFQLAWPPLAYSIRDDDEARRAYAAGLHLVRRRAARSRSRAVARSRAGSCACSPRRTSSASYKAIGLLATGIALYALYLAHGGDPRAGRAAPSSAFRPRSRRSRRTWRSTWRSCRRMGIVGAGIALVASYLVVLVLMYVFTQRLFPVPYEWGRLALVVGSAAALVGAGRRCCRPPASPGS